MKLDYYGQLNIELFLDDSTNLLVSYDHDFESIRLDVSSRHRHGIFVYREGQEDQKR